MQNFVVGLLLLSLDHIYAQLHRRHDLVCRLRLEKK